MTSALKNIYIGEVMKNLLSDKRIVTVIVVVLLVLMVVILLTLLGPAPGNVMTPGGVTPAG
jgi:hypothetical protein